MADRPQALSKQEIITIVLAVVLVALMVYLIGTQIKVLKEERANAAAEQANLQQDQSRLNALIKLSRQEDLMKTDLANCERLLPSEPGEDGLINDLQTLADQSSTKFTEIHFDKRTTKSGYTEMPVKISYQGNNEGFLKLLSGIQGWPRAIRIDSVQLSNSDNGQAGADNGPAGQLVKGDMEGAAFFQSQTQQPVNPAATKGGQ